MPNGSGRSDGTTTSAARAELGPRVGVERQQPPPVGVAAAGRARRRFGGRGCRGPRRRGRSATVASADEPKARSKASASASWPFHAFSRPTKRTPRAVAGRRPGRATPCSSQFGQTSTGHPVAGETAPAVRHRAGDRDDRVDASPVHRAERPVADRVRVEPLAQHEHPRPAIAGAPRDRGGVVDRQLGRAWRAGRARSADPAEAATRGDGDRCLGDLEAALERPGGRGRGRAAPSGPRGRPGARVPGAASRAGSRSGPSRTAPGSSRRPRSSSSDRLQDRGRRLDRRRARRAPPGSGRRPPTTGSGRRPGPASRSESSERVSGESSTRSSRSANSAEVR